jgi:hypothetical protein
VAENKVKLLCSYSWQRDHSSWDRLEPRYGSSFLPTKFALNNETPAAIVHQYSTALWEVISYIALYFLKHFILTFILQPNTKDLFPYKACITSA